MPVSVLQALKYILREARLLPTTSVELAYAVGNILAEPLIADRDFPPFDRVSMDGIAISFQSFIEGRRSYFIEAIQAAGAPQKTLFNTDSHCIEVMTGAILPQGTDTVVRYEDLRIENGVAHLQIEDINPNQNVHNQGYDRKKGEILVAAGTNITAAEIGIAATVGKKQLIVRAAPRICVISTGDELVEVEASPLPHQIRKSNVHSIRAALSELGLPSSAIHLPDNKEAISLSLYKALNNFDVLILSGGVSKGKYDFIPQALEELGVAKSFYKVAQKPGKPFWFGKKENTLVFAFPGNPVSSFLCYHVYFIPWWQVSAGLPAAPPKYAVLSKDFYKKTSLDFFLLVTLSYGLDGRLKATPTAGKGSGDLANLTEANAFMELPADREHFHAGEVFKIIKYKN